MPDYGATVKLNQSESTTFFNPETCLNFKTRVTLPKRVGCLSHKLMIKQIYGVGGRKTSTFDISAKQLVEKVSSQVFSGGCS
jgi:hypothetical protein